MAEEKEKYTRSRCMSLLREKQEKILRGGEKRYPARSDFSQSEVVAIKAFFGPWPRALEAAGIKPPRGDDRLQKNREKRIRAKRARIRAKKLQKENAASPQVLREEEKQGAFGKES